MEIIRNLNKIFNIRQKIILIVFMFLMVIGALLETLGVSLILPLVSAILDMDKILQNQYAQAIYNFLKLENSNQFIIFLLVALIFVYIFKNIYLALVNYLELKFVYTNQRIVAGNVLKRYLRKPYEYYLYASTGTIMRVLGTDVIYVFRMLTCILQIASECIVLVCIFLFLFISDAVMTAFMAVLLGTVLAVIYFFFRPRCQRLGEINMSCLAGMNQCQIQAFTCIKEVKVMHKEDYFINTYNQMGKTMASTGLKGDMYGLLPKYLIEAFSITGILLFLVISILAGGDIQGIVSNVAVFAFAAFRLMPSANRISAYLNSCASYKPSLVSLVENAGGDLKEQDVAANEKLDEVPVMRVKDSVKVKNLTFKYPNTSKYIFKQANMEIPAGKSVGIVGSSGAGKTTVVDILLGLLEMESGTIYADGYDIKNNYLGWLANIGYIPQMINMLDGSIKENVAFGVEKADIDEKRVDEVLKEAQMDSFIASLPKGINTKIGERGVRISGGQRQRIGIARALYSNPDLLIFDEATSALDNETEAAIMDAINSFRGKKTMIIIAHRLETIEECDMIYRVEDGKIVRER